MIAYLDTSVALRVLLRQRGALRGWSRFSTACSSEILGLEARRAIDRLRLEALLDDEGVAGAHEGLVRIEASIDVIALGPAVLRRAAAPLSTVVKTLDAIHLASAVLYRDRIGDDVAFVTHDAQQATAARALGFTRL